MKILVNGKNVLNYGGVINLSDAALIASETLGRVVSESEVELKCFSKTEVRNIRDEKINLVAWRIERNAREMRLGVETSDDLDSLDVYMQALADITIQSDEKGPENVIWPNEPA